MMDMPTGQPDSADNTVAAFQLENRAVRGRSTRLGTTLDQILSAHDYPLPVARLLGEAAIIAVLVGDSLKFDGRLIVQANGDGPVRFVVAEWVAGEGVRGFAQIDPDVSLADDADIAAMLGQGAFAMTIDPGGDMDRYQGVVALEGRTLAECAEGYFAQSEQTPTRLRIAVGEIVTPDQPHHWRGGGALIQQIAGDETRGSAEDDWDHARALFDTLTDIELADPDISSADLLYRLFHEEGVRLHPATAVTRRCPCTPQRLLGVLASFEDDGPDDADMAVITCEYCNRPFEFTRAEIEAVRSAAPEAGREEDQNG